LCVLQEEEWKSAVGTLSTEVGGKTERVELERLSDEMDERLRALAAKLTSLQRTCRQTGDDDEAAAGIRRQLLQRFNCLSCDKPVHMMPNKYQHPLATVVVT